MLLNLTFTGVVALNRVDQFLAPYGMVLKSFNVLAVVHGDPEPQTPTVIGERTLVAKSSVTSILDSLEKLGMVRGPGSPGQPALDPRRHHRPREVDDAEILGDSTGWRLNGSPGCPNANASR